MHSKINFELVKCIIPNLALFSWENETTHSMPCYECRFKDLNFRVFWMAQSSSITLALHLPEQY